MAYYPNLLGMGPQVPVTTGYPGLLGVGSPYQFANVVSPFANQYTAAGMLPIPSFTTPVSAASPAAAVPAQLLAAAPPPPRRLLMDDDFMDGDTEVFSWGNTNEYNPSSIPGTWENWSGALGNLLSFPIGTLANLGAGIIRGDQYGPGNPVSLNFFGRPEAGDPRPEWQRKSELVRKALYSAGRADAPGDPEVFPGRPSRVSPEIYPQPGMGPVTVTPLAPPPQWDSYLTTEAQRQENLARAQAAALDWDEGGDAWEEAPDDEDMGDFDTSGESYDDSWDDYGGWGD